MLATVKNMNYRFSMDYCFEKHLKVKKNITNFVRSFVNSHPVILGIDKR